MRGKKQVKYHWIFLLNEAEYKALVNLSIGTERNSVKIIACSALKLLHAGLS